MKKILITILIALSVTSIAYAANKWSLYYEIPEGNYQEIRMNMMGLTNIRVIKFQDGNTLCYLAYPSLNGNAGTPSLQCSIK